jgi:hypothetical protein
MSFPANAQRALFIGDPFTQCHSGTKPRSNVSSKLALFRRKFR